MTHSELVMRVKVMQKLIAEAYKAKDFEKVKSLQIGRIRSKLGIRLAVKNVANSPYALFSGVDKEI